MNPYHMTRVQGHNSYNLPPGVLKILSWNLQNFTGDHRLGMSHGAVGSGENMARAAVVASLMNKLRVDVLLVMETGSDVSGALEKIRSCLPDKDLWHPLVSGSTHAIPIIERKYNFAQKERTTDKMRALIRLIEFFDIYPNQNRRILGATQVNDGLRLLHEWKNNKDLTWLWNIIGASGTHPNGTSPDTLLANLIPPIIVEVGHVKADSPDYWQEVEDELNSMRQKLADGEDVIEETTWLRDYRMSPDKRANDAAKLEQISDALDFLELLGLMSGVLLGAQVWSSAYNMTPSSNDVNELLRTDFSPLAACLMASFSHLFIKLRGTVDELYNNKNVNFAYGALNTLGILDLIDETYGILFRPPRNFNGAMEQFFASTSSTGDFYGVAQKDQLGNWIGVQDPNSSRNWRSALHIKFPIFPDVSVPVCLFHTRFTGNESIKKQKVALTQTDKVIKMRCESVLDIAVWNNKTQKQQSLIIGDFNIPANHNSQVLKDFALEMTNQKYKRHGTPDAYEPTTLKSVKNIIKDCTNIYNEPYDGVFVPENFLGGKGEVQVSSAVTVSYMNFNNLATVHKDILKNSVVRQYVKYVNKISYKLTDLRDKLDYMCSRPGKNIVNVDVTFLRDANNLVNPKIELTNVGNHFTLNLATLDTNVVRPAHATFDAYKQTISRAAKVQALPQNVRALLASTEKEIDEVLLLMTTLEGNAVARKTVAYRQIVSDHIPVFIHVTYKH